MANGVEKHGNKLRIYFYYEGEKCREPLGLAATAENITYGEAKAAQINHEIKTCTFDYKYHFPNSKRVTENTLGHYIDIWLDLKKQELAASAYKGYVGIINRYIRPKFSKKSPESVDQIEIKQWMSTDLGNLASKTIKETIALLKQIYALYRTRHPNTVDPTAGLKIQLPDDEDPDVFILDEINLISNTPAFDDREQELNLARFLLWCGPRFSEAIAVAWEDIDLKQGTVNFKRARVRGPFKCTKTKRSTRDHELIGPAADALKRQFEITGKLPPTEIEVTQRDNRTKKKENVRLVFMN